MGKIESKQVNGVVDNLSDQLVHGHKTFAHAVSFSKGHQQTTDFMIHIRDGFIYWVSDVENLEEDGNHRLGFINGNFELQCYSGGNWERTGF